MRRGRINQRIFFIRKSISGGSAHSQSWNIIQIESFYFVRYQNSVGNFLFYSVDGVQWGPSTWTRFQDWGCVGLPKIGLLFLKFADWPECVAFVQTSYLFEKQRWKKWKMLDVSRMAGFEATVHNVGNVQFISFVPSTAMWQAVVETVQSQWTKRRRHLTCARCSQLPACKSCIQISLRRSLSWAFVYYINADTRVIEP